MNCTHYCVHESLLSPAVPFFIQTACGSLVKSGRFMCCKKALYRDFVLFVGQVFPTYLDLWLFGSFVQKLHYFVIHTNLSVYFKSKPQSAVWNKHMDLILVKSWSFSDTLCVSVSILCRKPDWTLLLAHIFYYQILLFLDLLFSLFTIILRRSIVFLYVHLIVAKEQDKAPGHYN